MVNVYIPYMDAMGMGKGSIKKILFVCIMMHPWDHDSSDHLSTMVYD